MKRSLGIAGTALGFLSKLDGKQYKQVTAKIFKLLDDPLPNDVIALKGYPGLWRTDIGEYRIIYYFTDDLVQVDGVGRRNDGDVYTRFDRTH